ncbi:hypothetical protein HON22_05895 [Candidatus Peregrinibacteria bacterium]|jgi:hypothetical protein|nr:hypothetical protein [Candidatus Peregrinibacteria bacterium]
MENVQAKELEGLFTQQGVKTLSHMPDNEIIELVNEIKSRSQKRSPREITEAADRDNILAHTSQDVLDASEEIRRTPFFHSE